MNRHSLPLGRSFHLKYRKKNTRKKRTSFVFFVVVVVVEEKTARRHNPRIRRSESIETFMNRQRRRRRADDFKRIALPRFNALVTALIWLADGHALPTFDRTDQKPNPPPHLASHASPPSPPEVVGELLFFFISTAKRHTQKIGGQLGNCVGGHFSPCQRQPSAR